MNPAEKSDSLSDEQDQPTNNNIDGVQAPAQAKINAVEDMSSKEDDSNIQDGPNDSPAQAKSDHDAGTPNSASSSLLGGSIVESKKSKKRTLGIVASIVALVAFFIGGGAYAYLGVYVPNKPENVMKAALANTLDQAFAETVKWQFDGEVEVSGDDAAGINGAAFNAYYDAENQAIDGTINIDATVTTITVDLIRPADSSKSYYRLSGLEGIGGLLGGFLGSGEDVSSSPFFDEYVNTIVSSVNNQWVEVEDSLFNQFTEDINPTEVFELSDSDKETIKQTYLENEFFIIKEQKADEDINSVPSFQYEMGVDKNALVGFMKSLKDADIDGLDVSDQVIEEVQNEDAAFDETITVWIAKKSKQFTQVALTSEDDGTIISVRVAIAASAEQKDITAPEGAKSILELIDGLYPTLNGSFEETGAVPSLQTEPEGQLTI